MCVEREDKNRYLSTGGGGFIISFVCFTTIQNAFNFKSDNINNKEGEGQVVYIVTKLN